MKWSRFWRAAALLLLCGAPWTCEAEGPPAHAATVLCGGTLADTVWLATSTPAESAGPVDNSPPPAPASDLHGAALLASPTGPEPFTVLLASLAGFTAVAGSTWGARKAARRLWPPLPAESPFEDPSPHPARPVTGWHLSGFEDLPGQEPLRPLRPLYDSLDDVEDIEPLPPRAAPA